MRKSRKRTLRKPAPKPKARCGLCGQKILDDEDQDTLEGRPVHAICKKAAKLNEWESEP